MLFGAAAVTSSSFVEEKQLSVNNVPAACEAEKNLQQIRQQQQQQITAAMSVAANTNNYNTNPSTPKLKNSI